MGSDGSAKGTSGKNSQANTQTLIQNKENLKNTKL